MNEPVYDIVIVGGGIVGATLACALADSGLHIAVIEAKAPPTGWPRDSWDLRVSAVTSGSQRIFDTLGVWQDMVAERVSPFREMHVWDATGAGLIHFDCADIGEQTLGYIVENRVIQAALLRRINELDTIEWISSSSINAIHYLGEQAFVYPALGSPIKARLVIGADGPDSTVRRLAGIGTLGWDYRQRAIVATVRTSNSHLQTAWQRFLPGGPLAFLPLTDGYSSIVWSVSSREAERLLALNESAFEAELQRALGITYKRPGVGRGLGEIEAFGPRADFGLRLLHADNYVRPRLALIGDAAHTVHPLAGQGANLGLSDAAALAEVLIEAQAKGKDIGAFSVLRRYERWRKGDNVVMMTTLDGLKRLFGTGLPPLRWARNWGLKATHAATPVKNVIMRRAMGLTGDLPKLARGIPLGKQ